VREVLYPDLRETIR